MLRANDDLEAALELLSPMHVLLSADGVIEHVGPTLQKLRPKANLVGRSFLDVFHLNRPRAVADMERLMQQAGVKLHLTLEGEPRTDLKGILVPRNSTGGAIVDLSFGISILDAVQDYALTSADFAATDLTIELLYLVEAKSAAMDALRSLNLRLQGARIAAEEQAFTDTLTGLRNRRALDQVLTQLLRTPDPFALMHLDLDFFKEVNDSKGHAAGDYVLQEVSQIMVQETRDADTVARVGGDEFVILIDKIVDPAKLHRLALRLIEQFEIPMTFNGDECRISASIGSVIRMPGCDDDPANLLHEADVALYAAKNAGRGQHMMYHPSLVEADAQSSSPTTSG